MDEAVGAGRRRRIDAKADAGEEGHGVRRVAGGFERHDELHLLAVDAGREVRVRRVVEVLEGEVGGKRLWQGGAANGHVAPAGVDLGLVLRSAELEGEARLVLVPGGIRAD